MIELLSKCPQIVLLGHSIHTREIIKSLNRDYSISPTLFDHQRPEGFGFFIQYSYIKQKLPDNEYYILQSLLDIPNENEHHNNYVLIPLSPFSQDIVQKNIERLESIYIVSRYSDLISALPSFTA